MIKVFEGFRMVRYIAVLVFGTMFVVGGWCHAMVDTKMGAFLDQFVDAPTMGRWGYVIQRTYNSRSKSPFVGIFGPGWMSELNDRIVILPEGAILHIVAGSGSQTLYPSPDYSSRADKNVQAIIAALLSRGRIQDSQVIRLKSQLLSDHQQRNDLFANLNLTGAYAPAKEFHSEDGKSSVEVTTAGLRRSLANKVELYDSSGRLLERQDGSHYLKFSYQGLLLHSVTSDEGGYFIFGYAKSRLLQNITATPPNGQAVKLKYEFDKNGRLSRVSNGWGNIYAFKYEAGGLLSEERYPNNSITRVSYYPDSGLVSTYSERLTASFSGCTQLFSYWNDEMSPDSHFSTKVSQKCGSNTRFLRTEEFWIGLDSQARRYEARYKISEADSSSDFRFGANGEMTQTESARGSVTVTHRNSEGYVTSIIGPTASTIVEFDSICKAPTLVRMLSSGREDDYQVARDSVCNIKSITRHDETVELTFGVDGRVTEISGPILGSFQFGYDSNGALKSLIALPRGAAKVKHGDIEASPLTERLRSFLSSIQVLQPKALCRCPEVPIFDLTFQ